MSSASVHTTPPARTAEASGHRITQILGASAPQNARLPHVLLVLDGFPKALGGGERIALRLADLLPAYGYRASILSLAVHPESSIFAAPPSCPVYFLPLQRTYDLTAFRAAIELRRFVRQHNVQIVQTFFESSDIWAGSAVKALTGAKLVWSRRDMGILRTAKHRAAYRLLAGIPDKVFAVSEQVRRHCMETDRIDSARVLTVYNGLDLAHWDSTSAQRRAPGTLLVTTLGNIRRVKGHDLLIRAAALVLRRFPQVVFEIAGAILEPDYFAELQSLIRDLDLSDHVKFVGSVTDIRKHLERADIFVLPSRSEGFSNAIIEAMAGSLPVVATDVGGNGEAVQDGVSGFIVPAEDPEALAQAILQLAAHPEKAQQMGASGKLIVTEKFTVDAMMGQIIGAYRSLLATA